MASARCIGMLGVSLLMSSACAKVLDIKDAELESANGGATALGAATGKGGAAAVGGARTVGGASVGGASTGGVPSTLDAAIQSFAEADCGKYQTCAPAYVNWFYGTMAECVARDILENRWLTSLPGVAWKASNFIACGNAWAKASCADYLNSTQQPACVVPGTFANSVACNSSFQCASQFCDTDGLSCGLCIDAPTEGEFCATGGCAVGLTCVDDGTCQRRRALGESCGGNLPCLGQLDCYQGLCVAPLATVGAGCDTSVNLYCDLSKSLICATSTNQCVPISQWAAPGQACGVDSSSSSATLCSHGSCSSSQLCVADAPDHAACDESVGPYCEWPASCDSFTGTCELESDIPICR